MFWQSQGGGPWGSGPRGGGPWGGNRGNSGGGPSPRGRGPMPPDFEELLRRGQDRFRKVLPGGFGTGAGIGIALVAILVFWLASGFYRVLPDEVGVVLRFGAYNRTTQPGLNYHLPAPIETALTPKVTRVNRTEIGYRSPETQTGREPASRQLPEESLMLTGDENIVDVNCAVFWVIKDAQGYLFNIRDPEKTVKAAAESALREVIGEHPLAMILANGRAQIESDTQTLLQQLLDYYRAGIEVTQVQLQRVDPPAPVIDAFRDVQRALADQARLKNEADAYRNDIIPRAHGEAAKIGQDAEGYRQQIVARAQGDADRFDAVYQAFKATQDVTLQRIYLETMEEILKNSNKVIIDKSAGGGSGVIPYLPLPALRGGNETASAPAEGDTSGGSASSHGAAPQSTMPALPSLRSR
jgi:modulator of FtsH protease HflK